MRIRYQYLLNRPLISRLSKSKYLHVYLYFIEFQDSSDIPFLEIARLTNADPHAVRALMRPATQNESIADALIELGVEPEDLPPWMKMSKSVKRMRARARKQRNDGPTRAAREQVVYNKATSPAIGKHASHPLASAIALATSYRPYKITEAENIFSNDAFYGERPLSPAEEAFWRARLKALRDDEREREEERRKEERERRPLTPEERKTYVEAKILYQKVQNQRHTEEYLICKTNIDFKAASDRAIFEKDLEEGLQLFRDTMANVGQVLNEMRTPPPSTKIEPVILSGKEDQYEHLRELNHQKDKEKMDGILAIAEFTRDERKNNRATKMYRHGSLLRPQKVYYPPGYKPVQLLDGPRGERINKLLNLDHLREIE